MPVTFEVRFVYTWVQTSHPLKAWGMCFILSCIALPSALLCYCIVGPVHRDHSWFSCVSSVSVWPSTCWKDEQLQIWIVGFYRHPIRGSFRPLGSACQRTEHLCCGGPQSCCLLSLALPLLVWSWLLMEESCFLQRRKMLLLSVGALSTNSFPCLVNLLNHSTGGQLWAPGEEMRGPQSFVWGSLSKIMFLGFLIIAVSMSFAGRAVARLL